MSKLDEHLTDQFYRWELRGRGWQVFEQPVALEPVFVPFFGYSPPTERPRDDGRRQTTGSGFLARLRQQLVQQPRIETAPEEEPGPELRESGEIVELQLSLPLSRSVPSLQVGSFVRLVTRASEPVGFEIIGTGREIVPQYAVSSISSRRVRQAVESCFPGIVSTPAGSAGRSADALAQAWQETGRKFAVVELGLGREFMLPLGPPHSDVLASLVAAMDGLEKEELGLFQVLFEPAKAPWPDSMQRAVRDVDDKALFTNREDLSRGLQWKTASPLFGVVVRLASAASDTLRAWEIIADLATVFSAFAQPGSNYLVPLDDSEYPTSEHEDDILDRLSRRSGMLLSMEELIPLITPPSTAVSRRLRRETRRTNAAPNMLVDAGALLLGANTHSGSTSEVFLSREHRVRHMHVIGASGFGKSTLLLNLIRQDIKNGEGLAVLDPHGDLIDAILGAIPAEREGDVVVLDPSDEQYPVGFNILAAHSDFERSLLASDLTSIFRRLSTSWGDQMESVLRNAILAFLESSRGGTLLELRRFLINAGFRNEFLQTVGDPEVVYYWQKAFPQLTGGKSIGPVLTRLDEFLSRKPIRYMVSQDANRVDFAEIIDRGQILLVRLPQGLIGKENTALLGSLVTAKLQMAAMSRQRMPAGERRDFWCYMDEFQHFITPSMAEILAGARKYRLGLILAHQELRQLDCDRDVASAVLSNCYTRVVFKVGDADARGLESGFSHFEARDLMNLGNGEAVCRVERSDYDFNLAIPLPIPLDEIAAGDRSAAAIASSRAKYARPRSEVEAELLRKMQQDGAAPRPMRHSTAPQSQLKKAQNITPEVQELPTAQETERTCAKGEAEAESAPLDTPGPSKNQTDQLFVSPDTAEDVAHESMPPRDTIHPSVSPETRSREAGPQFGRGGVEHKEIQRQVKELAEKLGFHAEAEKAVLGGAGHVDVSLTAGILKVACEISSKTPIQGEIDNAQKCLAAGYDAVITVAVNKSDVIALAQALRAAFTEAESQRIHVCQLRGVGALLKRMIRKTKMADPETRQSGGYKVKRKYANDPTDHETRKVEADILQAIARGLRGE